MSSRLSSVFPRPSASDADDVVWTLQTAAVQWQRGLRADAIVWVRKAADTATHIGHGARAEELRNHAARLAEFLWSDPEETIQDAPIVPPSPRRASGRRLNADDAEEIMELEELDAEELEFTENDLPTPDDAVADISDEDLTYYREGGEGSEPTHVLPDDLDLRSDSESPSAGRETFLSISPEPDEESDSYISISPEEEAERGDTQRPLDSAFDDEAFSDEELSENDVTNADLSKAEASHDAPSIDDLLRNGQSERAPSNGSLHVHGTNGTSSFAPGPPTDRPSRPRIERPPLMASSLRTDPVEVKSPTLPSPMISNAPRARAAGNDAVSIRSSAHPTREPVAQGPTLEELARLLAPHSSMAKRSLAPSATPLPISSPLPPPESAEGQPPSVDGLDFESVEALADLPEEAQVELAAGAQLLTLTSGQTVVLREGAALITRGTVHVTLTYSDVSAARVGAGAVVAARGSVEAGPLRLIADSAQTHIVTWTEEQMTQAMRDCPWVVDDLRLLADRFQAHASAGLGPLGERLDDALRAAVYERLQVRVLSPDESVAERGKPLKGLFVVAVGELNVSDEHRPIRAGEFLFPSCVIGAEPAPHDVKAGPKGGLVLFATRPVAHELMMSVPPLLEILAS